MVPPYHHRSPADFSRLIDFEGSNLVLLQGKLGLFFFTGLGKVGQERGEACPHQKKTKTRGRRLPSWSRYFIIQGEVLIIA